MSRVHIIGIGGSVMHALALELKREGYGVSGSDDRIEEPSYSRLKEAGLLPEAIGWFPERITSELSLVIVGMHARSDNPELLRAQALSLPVMDMPTYLAARSEHQHRIVVAGSHGKTTTTALLITALRRLGMATDWLIGAQTAEIPSTLRLSGAPTFVLEGDEYPASPLNPRPKAAIYRPHWLILTGIAWDHANIYPTPEAYTKAFEHILQQLPKAGLCFYNASDPYLKDLVDKTLRVGWHRFIPYQPLPYLKKGQQWMVRVGRRVVPVRFWGKHNLLNVSAVWRLLQELSVEDKDFAEILSTFSLPERRQEIWLRSPSLVIVRDFAHAPSKVQATLEAIKETFPNLPLLAVLELHTHSSFLPAFLAQYRPALTPARRGWVFVEPHRLAERQAELSALQRALDGKVRWFLSRDSLVEALRMEMKRKKAAIVLMSSGSMGGLSRSDLGISEGSA
ncbi:MAG: Mur ligase family protein [Bacteroidia bacterium]|nr:Mur ligase family protein [Bacteroidia bacterium]MDW8235638.1 Mur ligase family protein [Bacteroidia bacterium]